MRSSIWILLRAQLLNQLRLNDFKYETDKRKKTRTIAFAVSMGFVAILVVSYSFGIGYGLGSLGLADAIPGCAFAIASLMVLFFTLFKVNGTIFAFKGYDMLMALPVPTSAVITSRFLLLYGMNALFSLGIMLPMGIAYCLWVQPQALFYVMWTISIFVTPFIPMTIATVLGTLVSAISSKSRHTNVVGIVLSFVLLFGFMGASLSTGTLSSSQMSVEQLASLGSTISQKMDQAYPLTGLFENAIRSYDLAAFLAFLTIPVVWYLLFVKIVSIRYKAINTGLTTQHAASDYKLQRLQVNSPFGALYRKELRRFFSSNSYVLNMGFGAVFLLVASIACFIIGIDRLEQLMGMPNMRETAIGVAPFAIAAILGMSCTTCVSISLEGKNLWILQSSPLKPATIYRSKMAVNMTILVPIALLSSLFISLCLTADFLSAVWIFVIPLAYVGLTAVWGIFVNLSVPDFSWESEVTVIKQSMAAMAGIFGGLLFGLIPIGTLLLLNGVDRNLLALIVAMVVMGLTVALYKKVCTIRLSG